MFALNLLALASDVDELYPSVVGWIFIAVAWFIIGTLWRAGSNLTAQKASQSSGLAQVNEAPGAHSR